MDGIEYRIETLGKGRRRIVRYEDSITNLWEGLATAKEAEQLVKDMETIDDFSIEEAGSVEITYRVREPKPDYFEILRSEERSIWEGHSTRADVRARLANLADADRVGPRLTKQSVNQLAEEREVAMRRRRIKRLEKKAYEGDLSAIKRLAACVLDTAT
jgi:hypothetical protein